MAKFRLVRQITNLSCDGLKTSERTETCEVEIDGIPVDTPNSYVDRGQWVIADELPKEESR